MGRRPRQTHYATKPTEISCGKDSFATVKDLTVRIVVTSVDIASTPDVFGRLQQSIVRQSLLCYDLCGRKLEQFMRQSLVAFLRSSCDALFVM
ncbi:hypothetical protein TNCV_2260741 [Trichonephila clavipes]|nr:hypothetical protein TNCV_2260741 [Trichonephila clavipes]